MLTGRESLIRVIGKRRRDLPSRHSILSTAAPTTQTIPDNNAGQFSDLGAEEYDNNRHKSPKSSDSVMHTYLSPLMDKFGLSFEETALPKNKYEEYVYINNHTTVWGSWWNNHPWGYKCCKQLIRNRYCTGSAGIEAAEAAADLMKANIARKEAVEDVPAPTEQKQLATWGTDIPDDLLLDQGKLAQAFSLQKKIHLGRGLADVLVLTDEVTAEHMEAYRMTVNS